MSEDLLNDLRSLTLGKAANFNKKLVSIEGKNVEVREPSERVRQLIMDECGAKTNKDGTVAMDIAKARAYSMIHLCYVPGTDTKIFKPTDLNALLEQPISSGWASSLGDAALQMFGGGEAVENFSEQGES